MKIAVSACLAGDNCKYDGGNNYSERLADFIRQNNAEVIKICPEVMGGLPTPRIPSEIVDGVVTNQEGMSVDKAFRSGAARAFDIVKSENPDLAVLQLRSPSCGVKQVYDGTFSGKKIPGSGVFAAMLINNSMSLFYSNLARSFKIAFLVTSIKHCSISLSFLLEEYAATTERL